jgi:hypothetical protein
MNKHDKHNVEELEKIIDKYVQSGMSMSDFIKENVFKEYVERGGEDLQEIAAEYFLDHLDKEDN